MTRGICRGMSGMCDSAPMRAVERASASFAHMPYSRLRRAAGSGRALRRISAVAEEPNTSVLSAGTVPGPLRSALMQMAPQSCGWLRDGMIVSRNETRPCKASEDGAPSAAGRALHRRLSPNCV